MQMTFNGDSGKAAARLVPSNSRFRLVQLASVQHELHLSPQQLQAVGELKAKPQENAVEKEIVRLLTPEQARRLDQLLLQQADMWAFQYGAVRRALDLSAV